VLQGKKTKIATFIGCAAIVLATVMWWCATGGSHLVWGTVGEWVGGVGSMAAAVAAVAIAIRDGRQREQDRRDEQAAQARLVTVEARAVVAFSAVIEVTNHSTTPVLAVRIEHVHTTPEPSRAQFLEGKSREWGRLDAGEKVSAVCHLWLPDGSKILQPDELTVITAEISFVDARGLRWRRWANLPPVAGRPVDERQPPKALPEMATLRVDG
jgi:hypothetical protein